MPPVRGRRQQAVEPARGRRRKAAPPPPEPEYESVDASSVVFGLVMVLAVIVAGAALMGGSLSKMGNRATGAFDGVAGAFGLAIADVKVVGLEGDAALAAMVVRQAEVESGDNMFTSDPHKIRRRILATGQVTDARVYRLWPNQILIHASPAEPVALWHDGEKWTVVDSLGKLIKGVPPEQHADLIRVAGQGAPDGVPALVRAMGINQSLATKVSYAQRVSERRWDIKLKTGATIRLPVDHSVGGAAAMLAELDNKTSLTSRSLDRIDLRVPGKIFLKPTRTVGAGSAPAES
ncbi:cell division protein FtsQ/DivIB [Henriciella sp. AS95]|uniref:cell division protein FtsQ/DivIB n=1 Tax=Henriciella sp. AS95 TaxID=3135782 RepID=UPI00317ABAB3